MLRLLEVEVMQFCILMELWLIQVLQLAVVCEMHQLLLFLVHSGKRECDLFIIILMVILMKFAFLKELLVGHQILVQVYHLLLLALMSGH